MNTISKILLSSSAALVLLSCPVLAADSMPMDESSRSVTSAAASAPASTSVDMVPSTEDDALARVAHERMYMDRLIKARGVSESAISDQAIQRDYNRTKNANLLCRVDNQTEDSIKVEATFAGHDYEDGSSPSSRTPKKRCFLPACTESPVNIQAHTIVSINREMLGKQWMGPKCFLDGMISLSIEGSYPPFGFQNDPLKGTYTYRNGKFELLQ